MVIYDDVTCNIKCIIQDIVMWNLVSELVPCCCFWAFLEWWMVILVMSIFRSSECCAGLCRHWVCCSFRRLCASGRMADDIASSVTSSAKRSSASGVSPGNWMVWYTWRKRTRNTTLRVNYLIPDIHCYCSLWYLVLYCTLVGWYYIANAVVLYGK